MIKRKIARYGWKPDLPDHRDHIFRPKAAPMPAHVDLRAHCSPVEDQGSLGSCTGNALVGCMEYIWKRDGHRTQNLSRLFAYYNARVLENTVNDDAGAEIRDVVKAAVEIGVCVERAYPYDISQFTTPPPAHALVNAQHHRISSYCRIEGLHDVKASLAQGNPVIFGFSVYANFESELVAKTGDLQMPQAGEPMVGGHAVLAVGYDDDARQLMVRNSWGRHWGRKGYFTMPYEYVDNSGLSDDFWTIRK